MIGHGPRQASTDGFRVTFTRGVEWAATGDVKQSIPSMAQ